VLPIVYIVPGLWPIAFCLVKAGCVDYRKYGSRGVAATYRQVGPGDMARVYGRDKSTDVSYRTGTPG
jgi:predicted aminopeptidase